jgi:pimeloyl-ACP methyl ester carboxylesterase
MKVAAVREQNQIKIQTITYLVRPTESVTAVLVTSAHRGPGVVYAHGGQSDDPEAFLGDALALVAHGGAAIMPDIGITMVGDPHTDLAYVVDTVIAERRALDILTGLAVVDRNRLDFVGHSWGAEIAAIMTGIEPRLSRVAIVCGWSRMSTDMADTASVADVPPYLAVTSVLDGVHYVAIPGTRKILIQYGTQDPNIPQAQRVELTKAAVGSVTRKDYDAGHDLVNNPAAAADRLAFLTS